MKPLAQVVTAGKEGQNSNPGLSDPKSLFVTATLWDLFVFGPLF